MKLSYSVRSRSVNARLFSALLGLPFYGKPVGESDRPEGRAEAPGDRWSGIEAMRWMQGCDFPSGQSLATSLPGLATRLRIDSLPFRWI